MEKDRILRNAESLVEDLVYRGVSIVKVLKRGEGLSDSEGSIGFTYVGTDGEGEYVGKMFYSDGYFEKPSTEYNRSLATASIAVAMSCGNSQAGYENGFRNVESLMVSMGFKDVCHNESYEIQSSLDTIGVVIGRRDIGDCTLLCMGIRGIGYGSEWGSNLIIGTGIYHQGFDEASDRAIRFLREYVEKHSLAGRVKLWVTGYSRSASTTNLVAGKIDTAIAESRFGELIGNGISLDKGDIYAYCFEPAETVMADAFDIHGPYYNNIWNHINPSDPIPIMVTSCLGMERFGTDLMFPSPHDSNYRGRRDRMLEFYNGLPNRREIGICRSDLFTAVGVNVFGEDVSNEWDTQVDFLGEFNRRFAEYVGSREFYAENLQSGLSEYVARRNAYVGSEKFKGCFRQALGDNKLSVISAILSLEKGDIEGVKLSLRKPVVQAAHAAGLGDDMVEEFTTTLAELLMIFKEFIRQNRLMVFNFLLNARTIFFAHYPELIFSWLMSSDPNYAIRG